MASSRHSELFPIVLFLGAAWIFVLNRIQALTASVIVSDRVPCFVYAHIVLTFYLAVGLYLLHRVGILSVTYNVEDSAIERYLNMFFFQTWLSAFVSCLAAVALSPIAGAKIGYYFVVYGFIFFVCMYFVLRPDMHSFLHHTLTYCGIMVAGALIYVPVILIAISDVSISTDKGFYTSSDNMTFSVSPIGYAFLPQITHVKCGAYDLFDWRDGQLECPEVLTLDFSEPRMRYRDLVVKYKVLFFDEEKHFHIPVTSNKLP
jgi:hypothetical protein